MKKIMEISLVFESNSDGIVIVGVNPDFDPLNIPEIKKIIGDHILVKNQDNEIKLKVKSSQISNSISDRKNIVICVGDSIKVNELKIGSIVYSVGK